MKDDLPVYTPYIAAVGGIGGSGTRMVAKLLKVLGYYIGDDVNNADDNLWFTLLFKRRSVLFEDDATFCLLAKSFFSRMAGNVSFSPDQCEHIRDLARLPRLQGPAAWLQQRATSYLDGACSRADDQPWGWKEPNSHIVIDRLLALEPRLRYIHVLRHPIEMALSNNLNQLEFWGPMLLERNVEKSPRDALSYWCAVHKRMTRLRKKWHGRIAVVSFEKLCTDPEGESTAIARFLEIHATRSAIVDYAGTIQTPLSRASQADLSQFDPSDLSYVFNIGYALHL